MRRTFALACALSSVASLAGQTAWIRAKGFTGELGASAMAFDPERGRTVLFGSVGAVDLTPETWEWDGVTWLLRAPSHAPSPRRGAAMAHDPRRHSLLLFGGETPTGGGLADTWEWDGIDWRRLTPNASPSARKDHGMVTDTIRGRIVLYGGGGRTDTWEWDGTTWTRSVTVSVPPASLMTAMAFDASRGVVLLQVANHLEPARTWAYDGQSWIGHATSTGPADDREGMAMEYDADHGRIVLYGGLTKYQEFPPSNLTWTWDGLRWSMVSGTPQPPLRGGHRMVYDSVRKRIVMHGGRRLTNDPMTSLLDTWEWDGATWRERNGDSSPTRMVITTMTRDSGRDRIVMVGHDPSFPSLRTWEWDGVRWHSTSPSRAPSLRRAPALSGDGNRHRTVLFGGYYAYNYQYLADTWEWDGQDWILRDPPSRPPPRGDHAMAYDAARKVTVLFGGYGSHGFHDDTWFWNGDRWRRVDVAVTPPPRALHMMAFDARRGVMVLFGGIGTSGNLLDDTWEWDGQQWLKRASSHVPPARLASAMAYDTARGVCVLYAGSSRVTDLDDVWEWDGADWRSVTTAVTPGARSAHAMAYDEVRQQTVLHGRTFGSSNPLAETWLYGSLAATQPATTSAFGLGCQGTQGTPLLASTIPLVGRPGLTFDLASARPDAAATLAISTSSQSLPIGGGCTVYVGSPVLAPPLRTSTTGIATFAIPVPMQIALRGLTLYSQAFVLDENGSSGLALSSGAKLVFGY